MSVLAGLGTGAAVLAWFLPTVAARQRASLLLRDPAGRLLWASAWRRFAPVLTALAARRPGVRRAGAAARAEAGSVADSLAACLSAGCTPVDAAAAVALARPGAAGAQLAHAVSLIRLGADPAQAWRSLAQLPELAALGKVLARSADSGTAAAALVTAEAARRRLDRRLEADAAIARLGVFAAAPLGLCFLPAFLCLGVLPVVLGLGEAVLGASK